MWWIFSDFTIYVRCAILYHLYNLKNVKNTHGGVTCNFTKINTPPWVFFTFFKLYKWYQIEQRITYAQLSFRHGWAFHVKISHHIFLSLILLPVSAQYSSLLYKLVEKENKAPTQKIIIFYLFFHITWIATKKEGHQQHEQSWKILKKS